MDILRCPDCKGELELEVKEQIEGEIEQGELSCGKCGVSYPIEEGIPNMLKKIQR